MKTFHIVYFPDHDKKPILLIDGKEPVVIQNPKALDLYLQRAPYRKNILMVKYRHMKRYVIADVVMKRTPKIIKEIIDAKFQSDK